MNDRSAAAAVRHDGRKVAEMPRPTGRETWERALSLLGYDMETERAAMMTERGLCLLNVIVEDLRSRMGEPFVPLSSLEEELPSLGGQPMDAAAAYGVAMLLAQLEGDGSHQSFWARVYEGKREAAVRDRRLDVMPRPWGC